jgi:type IV secretory pathway VirB3-like protein
MNQMFSYLYIESILINIFLIHILILNNKIFVRFKHQFLTTQLRETNPQFWRDKTTATLYVTT